VDVVQHSDPQHDLVVVLVQVLPVLLVQVHPDVVLVFGDPGDAEWRVPTLARPAVFPLPPGLPASRDWIWESWVILADLKKYVLKPFFFVAE
jgi:hypothetical protein